PGRIRYRGFALGTRLSTGPAAGMSGKADECLRDLRSKVSSSSSALVQTLRRPVLETRAQREAARGQNFLDFVERLATEVGGLQQFGLGPLDQVADVVDVLGLQAVRRANR